LFLRFHSRSVICRRSVIFNRSVICNRSVFFNRGVIWNMGSSWNLNRLLILAEGVHSPWITVALEAVVIRAEALESAESTLRFALYSLIAQLFKLTERFGLGWLRCWGMSAEALRESAEASV